MSWGKYYQQVDKLWERFFEHFSGWFQKHILRPERESFDSYKTKPE